MGRKKKRKKRPRAARPSPARPPRAELVSGPTRRWIGLGLDVALAALCTIFLVKSASYAARAKFLSDECLHTYIVEQIVWTGHSPTNLDQLYSGMPNNTHPLFHWLGAVLYLIDGRASLPYLNIALCGVMLGLLYGLLRAWASATAARIAVSIVLLYDVVHVCTQIFYVEILAALPFMLAALALMLAVGRTDWKLSFLAGVACGLALLSKQAGYALVPVIVVCGLYFLVVQRWKHALGTGLIVVAFAATFAAGMSALTDEPINRCRTICGPIERKVVPEPLRLFQPERPTREAAPVALRDTQVPGGAATTDLHTAEGVKRAFGRQSGEILKSYARVVRPFGLLLTLLCVIHVFFSRPLGATAPLVLTMASLVAGAMYIGTVDDRHFIVCIPVMAACSGIALTDLLGRIRGFRHIATPGVAAVLIVSATVAVVRVPNYRLRPEHSRWRGGFGDAPQALIGAAEAIAKLNDPYKRPVLSMWTSATWYYSGHPTTWGGVNVPRLNSAMLNPDPRIAFKPYLDRRTRDTFVRGIRYILIDNRAAVSDEFYRNRGLGYSLTFFRNMTQMMREGVMRIVYPEDLARHQEALLRAGVFDTVLSPGAPPPREAIWGNPAVPSIVVEFNAYRYQRLLWSQNPPNEPAEGQAP